METASSFTEELLPEREVDRSSLACRALLCRLKGSGVFTFTIFLQPRFVPYKKNELGRRGPIRVSEKRTPLSNVRSTPNVPVFSGGLRHGLGYFWQKIEQPTVLVRLDHICIQRFIIRPQERCAFVGFTLEINGINSR